MTVMTEDVIVEKLNDLYQKRGYVSEDEIFELCDEHSLSFLMTDHVVNKLTDMGVLIADAPDDTSDNDYYDYSQIDYEQVYIFFEKLYPDMRPTLDYIRAIPPIQKGETKNMDIHALETKIHHSIENNDELSGKNNRPAGRSFYGILRWYCRSN